MYNREAQRANQEKATNGTTNPGRLCRQTNNHTGELPVRVVDQYNPQDYARSKMDLTKSFNVYRKCVHRVRKCRRCRITPLLNRLEKIVTYFVEHHDSRDHLLATSVGIGNVHTQSVLKRMETIREEQEKDASEALLQLSKTNHPEMMNIREEPNSDSISTPDTEPENDVHPDSISPPLHLEFSVDRELARIHSEHSVITEPDNTDHLTSTLGSQIEEVQEKMMGTFSSAIVKKASRCVEQLVILIIGLQYDTSLEAIVLRCIQFLSAITDGGLVMTLKDTLMDYVSKADVPSQLRGHTIREAFDVENSRMNNPEMLSTESLKIWETLKQGIFTKHLSYILGTVFAFSACKIKNVKFSHPIYERIIQNANQEEIDGMDLIDHAIKLYNWTSTVGMACLESRSLEPMMINSNTLAKCHEKYYFWYKRFREMKTSGVSTSEERQLMFVEVQAVSTNLERFVKVQKDKFSTLQASSLYKEVISLLEDVRDFVQKVDRVKVAKAYHLAGCAKSGKSTFSTTLAEQICLARGVPYRKEDNAQINLMAPYQDELTNSTQIVTINETVPIKEHLAKSIETAYNTSLALVDPVPFHPNRSSLEDKARITCTHVGVISTGNTVQPFLHVARTPGAWERRYPIIEVSVKEEFSDGFGRLVSSKCDGSNDYHLFNMYEIVYVGKERSIVYYELNGKKSVEMNTEECLELVRKQCIEHFEEQDRLMAEHTKDNVAGCLHCKRIRSHCKCPNSDDHTTSGMKVSSGVMSVSDSVTDEEVCPARTTLGYFKPRCDFVSGACAYCGALEEPDESVTQPEMGLVSTITSTAGSVLWSTVLPWINPFVKMSWIWTIDNNVMKVFHEELVEELSYWPDTLGCSLFRILPENWERRADGSLSWFGKRKDSFLRLLAAEKQIFLPITILLRRAFTIAFLSFFVLTFATYISDEFGMKLRDFEAITYKERTMHKWDWYYLFPEYSSHVMKNRDMYSAMGIYTERYLDWQNYYINIYYWEKALGLLCIPWYFAYTEYIPVLVTEKLEWWLIPLTGSCLIFVYLFVFMWARRWLGYQKRYEELQKRARSDKNFQHQIFEKVRRHTSEYNSLVPTAVGVIGAVVTGLVIWNNIRRPEHSIGPESKRTSWSDWFANSREVPTPFEPSNASASEGENRLVKAAARIFVELPDRDVQRQITGWFTRPGVLLLPRHIFKKDPYKEELYEYLDLKIEMAGKNTFKTKVRVFRSSLVRISGKDAVLINVFKGPSISYSIEKMLPTKTGTDHHQSRLLFLHDGSVCQETVSAKYVKDVDCAGFSCGRGLEYLSKHSGEGFCGSLVYSNRRDGAILGFHISGKPHSLSTRKGWAQEILYEDYTKALEKLQAAPSYLPQPEMGSLLFTRLGQNIIPCAGPHPKTEMFEEGAMDQHNALDVLGHDPKLVRYRSRVRKSLLSEPIAKRCEQPCRWKAPYLKEPWRHHNKALKIIAEGAREVPPEALKWATDDYWNQIFEPLKKYTKLKPDLCRPLTVDEAINGVPDSLYMGPFKMDTSAGIIPGTKEKSGLFVRIEPYEDGRKRYKLSDEADTYMQLMLSYLDRGVSFGVLVRTCLKDEVVKEDSEKVRIFYILECLFGLVCRMYFLPVAEFISRHPLETECMVGINCAGPEWEKLVKHITQLAKDGKLSDWDFSKYDIRRSPDVMCASLRLMIRIAEYMGYIVIILVRMRGCAAELRRPMVNWNGTIILMYIWCSGNTMTTYGNSLENSLHQRCSFYFNGVRILGLEKFLTLGRYCDNERIATYGDDGHAGSRPEVRELTKFSSRKAYFDHVGMGITDARKSDDPAEVVPYEEVDFLKRRSVYHPELGVRVGALDQESIWKMGHMSSGAGEPEDLAVASIQSMMSEAFLHGKDFYEELRGQLQLCAKDVNIWTEVLEIPYRDKVQFWHEKYDDMM